MVLSYMIRYLNRYDHVPLIHLSRPTRVSAIELTCWREKSIHGFRWPYRYNHVRVWERLSSYRDVSDHTHVLEGKNVRLILLSSRYDHVWFGQRLSPGPFHRAPFANSLNAHVAQELTMDEYADMKVREALTKRGRCPECVRECPAAPAVSRECPPCGEGCVRDHDKLIISAPVAI